MGSVCGYCAHYKQMPFNEDICTKKGKIVPFLAMNDCFVDRVEQDTNLLTQEDNFMAENANTKVCKECGRELPIDAFQTNYKSSDGHLNTCKECMAKKKSAAMKAKSSKPEEEVTSKVEQAFTRAEMNISSATDQELVDELRTRGWSVKCSRVIEL